MMYGKHGIVSSLPICSKTMGLMCNCYTRYHISVTWLRLPTIKLVVEPNLGHKINNFGKGLFLQGKPGIGVTPVTLIKFENRAKYLQACSKSAMVRYKCLMKGL